MKCKHCGAEIPDDSMKCPYCNKDIEKEFEVQSSLIGKKYTFTSARGTNIMSLLSGRIVSKVEIEKDRLFINITPKKYNVCPAVLFEDITGIDISRKINLYYWIWIILSVIAGLCGAPYCFIFTVLLIIGGLQRKITISQRNGIKVIMYAKSSSDAEDFRNDMKQVAKIQ